MWIVKQLFKNFLTIIKAEALYTRVLYAACKNLICNICILVTSLFGKIELFLPKGLIPNM